MNEDVAIFIEDLSQKKFVVFAGAGIETETGVSPSWKKLLERFITEEPTLDIGSLSNVKEEKYPEVAQEIFEKLVQRGQRDRYFEILKQGLRATNANYSSAQLDIVDTAKHVVTTNFDDTFENAVKRVLEDWHPGKNHIVQSLPELRNRTLLQDFSVNYLHGRVNEECLVFKSEDYKKFYPSQSGVDDGCDNLEKFLRNLYEEHTIVFIGFSFDDKYVLSALRKIYQDLAQNDIEGKKVKASYRTLLDKTQHYALLQKFNSDDGGEIRANELDKLLSEINIKAIRYEEHKDWTRWFERIRQRRRSQRTVTI